MTNDRFKVTRVLKDLGIRGDLKGFYCLRDAICLAMEDFSIVHNITKQLYPKVAKMNDTTPTRVERAMRHAIETCWVNVNDELCGKMFGRYSKYVPTNGDFVATIADFLLMEKIAKELEELCSERS